MAGVGFELKKLFRSKDGYLKNLHGFAISAAVTQGPMLLNILMLVLLRFLMRQTDAQMMDQEWFLYTVTYATMFSMIFSNTLLLFIDRFVSDCIYKGEEERILPSFFSLLVVLLGVFGPLALVYIILIPREPLYKLVALLQFGEMLVIWSEMSYLSAIKQYGKVLIGFLVSVIVASLTGFVLLRFTAMDRVCAALLAVCAGYAVMLLMYFQQMLLYYPHGSFNLFDCLPALDEHRILIAIGFFMALGIYAHNFVFWLSGLRNAIWPGGVFCTRYDIPTFFATFTITPMLILFVVAVETQVYEYYRAYFDAILYGGTLQDIQIARHNLFHVIFRECSHMMEIQLFVTIVCATFLGNFLSGLGLDAEQTAIFRILCFGYCLFGMMRCLFILMLYFEDRGGALVGTVLFTLLSTALSLVTLRMEPTVWGFGFTLAAFVTVLYAAFRIRYFLEHLDSKVFLRQPLFAQEQSGFFTRLSLRLTRLDERARSRFYSRHTRKMEKGEEPMSKFGMRLKRSLALLPLILLLTGCEQSQPPEEAATPTAAVDKAPVPDIDDVGMIEDKTIYDADDETSVVCFYVTVRMGDVGSDTHHTFAEVNNVVRFKDSAHFADDVYARALVQVGDETGPTLGSLGYGQTDTNATIRVRGNSSSTMPQKSYKLKLDDDAGLWRGQRNIALNKSIFDETRFRNKLYFDMLRDVEHISSIRTQFVHLYVKDETSGQTAFQDYGLFTQAEVPGSRYLMNHGLDREGYLYKAIAFNFEPREELRDFSDPAFDQEAFDAILTCKGRQDNGKLIELVNRIHDTSMDINDIIGPYIDRENYITWLAYNLLTANIDTTVQNFYLYSPTNSDKWFFIPWDGDNMLPWNAYRMEGSEGDYGDYLHGISNYWGIKLHQRFLKYEENRAALAQRVDELHEFINKETVDALAKAYNAVTESYALRMPDFYYLGKTAEERMEIVNGLGDEIETAYREFHESLTRLMPFFLQACTREKDALYLNWDEAYAFDFAPIRYRVTVSLYPDLWEPLVREETDVNFLSVSPEALPSGTYYWSVSAFTEDGRAAEPMNKIKVNDAWYPGVDVLEVP